jgi:excisionase family DNA binding protein
VGTAAGPQTRKHTDKMAEQNPKDALLTPAEVAAMFRVNPKTVTRWARAGKITAIRTLGGHRRFRASEISRCLEQMEAEEV